MASFRCYNNSDVIANLITTNFHLYLIHLWWQLFQMFVCGDVVYAQTWQVLTLKNCMEPFSYASTAYLVASALVSVRLFCTNLGNLEKFFGQMVYRPPWQKIAPTPMSSRERVGIIQIAIVVDVPHTRNANSTQLIAVLSFLFLSLCKVYIIEQLDHDVIFYVSQPASNYGDQNLSVMFSSSN